MNTFVRLGVLVFLIMPLLSLNSQAQSTSAQIQELKKQMEAIQQQNQQQDGAPQQTPAPEPQADQHQQATASEPQDQQGEQRQDATQENAPPPDQQTAAQQELRPEEAARLLQAIRERGREADNQRQQRRAGMQAPQVDKDW